jgi:lipoprotein-anchoring transpeptidase ErfK/SrfK
MPRATGRPRAGVVAATLCVALGLAACGTEAEPAPAPRQAGPRLQAERVAPRDLWVRTIATGPGTDIAVYPTPDAAAPALTLPGTRDNGAPLVLLAIGQQGDWLQVRLPVRPNGSTGWVRTTDVTLSTTRIHVVIELGAHRITVWEADQVLFQEPIGVGTGDTPTPPGNYYLTELWGPLPDGGAYGPWAFGVSGFSDVLLEFAGGNGQIGIHGTNDPSSVGRTVSHGCIRLHNDAIARMAVTVPAGAPVRILP